MKRALAILLPIFLLSSCSKDEVPVAGTFTIDNKIYGTDVYYAYGFSFRRGGKVKSLDQPEADFYVLAGSVTGAVTEAFLSANTLEPSFGLEGQYASAAEASAAFKALTEVGTPSWQEMAVPLRANQVWIVRTRDNRYGKIRITEVVLDEGAAPPFASCTFEWAYQPDGSTTFPQK